MKNHTGFISRFNAWLLHKGSDRYNERTHQQKKKMFSELSGNVLEIGPGTGANLEYYPDEVSLTGLEPNPHMQKYLREKAQQAGKSIEIITGIAEEIPAPDEIFDAVVSTLVLCSVESQSDSLSEIKRVLKPGGKFLFIEHVAARAGSFSRGFQKIVKPLWKRIADGCHPDRETWKVIEGVGFQKVNIEHFRLSLPIVAPHIIGTAIK